MDMTAEWQGRKTNKNTSNCIYQLLLSQWRRSLRQFPQRAAISLFQLEKENMGKLHKSRKKHKQEQIGNTLLNVRFLNFGHSFHKGPSEVRHSSFLNVFSFFFFIITITFFIITVFFLSTNDILLICMYLFMCLKSLKIFLLIALETGIALHRKIL